jgi:hypothetical protein
MLHDSPRCGARALLEPLELGGQRSQTIRESAVDPRASGAGHRAIDDLADRGDLAFDLSTHLSAELRPLDEELVGPAQDLAEMIADIVESTRCFTHRVPP